MGAAALLPVKDSVHLYRTAFTVKIPFEGPITGRKCLLLKPGIKFAAFVCVVPRGVHMMLSLSSLFWFLPATYLAFTFCLRANLYIHTICAVFVLAFLVVYRRAFFVAEETFSFNWVWLLIVSTLLTYISRFVSKKSDFYTISAFNLALNSIILIPVLTDVYYVIHRR